MKRNVVVDGQKPSISQLKEFLRQCDDGLLSFEQVQAINEGRFRDVSTIPLLTPDFRSWIKRAEEFNKEIFGEKIDLQRMFVFPRTSRWEHTLPVFLPAATNTYQCIVAGEKAGKGMEIDYDESIGDEEGVNKFLHFSNSLKPRLFLIELSEIPTRESAWMRIGDIVKMKRHWLQPGPYIIASALYHEYTGKLLDTTTDRDNPYDWMTCFPENPVGEDYFVVAYPHLYSDDIPKISFGGVDSDYSDDDFKHLAAREVVEVPLR